MCPAPGLDPEEFLSGELGARFDGTEGSFFVSVFYTDINDIITRIPAPGGGTVTIFRR